MSAEKLATQIRREQIAQAALNLVSSQGLRRLSVAGVARRVGLVPSALYRHFENKEKILDSLLDLIRDMLRENVAAVCRESPDALERLKKLLFRHIRMIRENEGIPRVIFSQDVYSGHPERKSKVYGAIKDYLQRVKQIIVQGQEEGRIKAGVDPDTLAMIFLGLIQPAGILWHLSEGDFDVTKHGEKAWNIFSAAVQVPPSSPKT